MGVFFILGKRTGQSLGIRRFLHRLKARIRVLMLQNLDFAADQIARFLQAVSGVFVEKDFRFSADRHRFRCNLGWFGGQVTSQHLIPCIAVIAVLVITVRTANQFPVCFIAIAIVVMAFGNFDPTHDFSGLILTAFLVLVPITLLQAAYQSAGFRVAIIRMHMLCTSQFVALHDVARICMDMGFFCFRYGIAAVRMRMCRNLRQGAPQSSVFVIAGRIVTVDNKIRVAAGEIAVSVITVWGVTVEIQHFRITNRHCLLNGSYLGVAGFRMGVFGYLAPSLFQGDGRQNQCVGGTEHHHTG